MMLTIVREKSVNGGYFGGWYLNAKRVAESMENADKAIPEGNYILIPYDSPTHGKTYVLENESLDVYFYQPDDDPETRDMIEIHAANYPDELLGCISAGTDYNDGALWHSRDGIKKVFDKIETYHISTIEIVNHEDFKP